MDSDNENEEKWVFSNTPTISKENDQNSSSSQNKKRILIIIIVSVVILIAIILGIILFIIFKPKKDEDKGQTNLEKNNVIKAQFSVYDDINNLKIIDLSNVDEDSINYIKLDGKNIENLTDFKGHIDIGGKGLYEIEIKFKSILSTMNSMFKDCENLIKIDLSKIDSLKIESMSEIFKGCSKLTSVDFSNFQSPNLFNISSMFQDCSSLNEINLPDFNTNNLKDISNIFNNCKNLKIIIKFSLVIPSIKEYSILKF